MKKQETNCPELNRLQDRANAAMEGMETTVQKVSISSIDVQDIVDYVFGLEERVQLKSSLNDLSGGDLWAFDNIRKALVIARDKHPHWFGKTNPMHGMLIVAEECGEAVRATVQHIEDGARYSEIEKELEQTAASCIRFLTKR